MVASSEGVNVYEVSHGLSPISEGRGALSDRIEEIETASIGLGESTPMSDPSIPEYTVSFNTV
jgi:hypothetical protein